MKNIIILILFFISFNAYSQKTIITEIKLKNGWTVRGNIIDSIPNKSYTIKTLKGVEQSYSLDEIEKISKITVGKDKVDYIPKGKFSANIDLGLQNFSNKYSYDNRELGSKGNGKLFGVSVNYNLYKNVELGLSYLNFNTEIEEYEIDRQSKDFTKINLDMNQYSVILAKYFTGYKIKPFLSVNLCYKMSVFNSTKYDEYNGAVEVTSSKPNINDNYFSVQPGIGAVYFINRNFSISTLYIFNTNKVDYFPKSYFEVLEGFYICRLKYTFIK
jgi:hypothetical protein